MDSIGKVSAPHVVRSATVKVVCSWFHLRVEIRKPYEVKPHGRFHEGSIGLQDGDLHELDTHPKGEK